MDDIAEHLNVSTSMLYREMRQQSKKSLKRILMDRKINEAKRLLLETDASIESIAVRCGYTNGQNLTAVFRKKVNRTPGKWRIENR